MARQLDTATLNGAAQYYASLFLADAGERDRAWVMGQFHNFTFKDEFEYLAGAMADHLGSAPLSDFKSVIARLAKEKPRKDSVFETLLAEKLAIDPDGNHIAGRIGTTIVDGRLIGTHMIEVEPIWSIKRRNALGLGKEHREVITRRALRVWNVYAGETEERLADSGVADPLPEGTPGMPVGALNTRISNEVALLMCDACVDNLDEGTLGAVIQGRTGVQPADPDTAVTGTNLFTLTCATTAFGAAADAAPGAIATAAAITDDSSADATGTLGYCRASSSSVADTPLDDHIDGEAGTSGADWNFNTLSIVAGAVVSASSWTVTMPES